VDLPCPAPSLSRTLEMRRRLAAFSVFFTPFLVLPPTLGFNLEFDCFLATIFYCFRIFPRSPKLLLFSRPTNSVAFECPPLQRLKPLFPPPLSKISPCAMPVSACPPSLFLFWWVLGIWPSRRHDPPDFVFLQEAGQLPLTGYVYSLRGDRFFFVSLPEGSTMPLDRFCLFLHISLVISRSSHVAFRFFFPHCLISGFTV